MDSRSFATAVLSPLQVERLLEVMVEPFEIHGVGNFPTLHIRLRDLIPQIIRRIPQGIHRGVKMNGGLASHILSANHLPFNDVDLIFDIDLCNDPARSFEAVRTAVLDSLLEFFPSGAQKSKLSRASLQNAYIRKLVKVTDGDVWSLISLNNNDGRYVDLKFVDRMRRQFEFSVDSFQLQLDQVLSWLQRKETELNRQSNPRPQVILAPNEAQEAPAAKTPGISCWDDESLMSDSGRGESERDNESDYEEDLESTASHRSTSPSLSDRFFDACSSIDDVVDRIDSLSISSASKVQPNFELLIPSGRSSRAQATSTNTQDDLPVVWAESMFGDFQTALFHLDQRLIDTKQPEEIRGGGLLKYCKLLAMGYKAARPRLLRQAERYMCSRFFIDFSDVNQQYQKLEAYLSTHFSRMEDPGLTYDYLVILYKVVEDSTVCLMSHERQMTLEMIDNMARQVASIIARPAGIVGAAHSNAYGQQVNVFEGISQRHQGMGYIESTVVPTADEGSKLRHTILYLSHNGSYWLPLSSSFHPPEVFAYPPPRLPPGYPEAS